MTNTEADFLFPPRVIPALRDLRGILWQGLVDLVAVQPPDSSDRAGFVLMMVRMSGCSSCQADSFRAMRGCLQCSTQTIKRFRGGDHELLDQFVQSRNEIEQYKQNKNTT